MARHSSSYWKNYPDTSTLPVAADFNDWEAAHDSMVGALRTRPVRIRVVLAADVALGNNVNQQITGWTETRDVDNAFANDAFTVPLPNRWWTIVFGCRFAGSGSGGYRYNYLINNSTTVTTASILAQDGGFVPSGALATPGDYRRCMYDGPLNQGDVVRMFAVQNSGANLNVTSVSQLATYGDTWVTIRDSGPA